MFKCFPAAHLQGGRGDKKINKKLVDRLQLHDNYLIKKNLFFSNLANQLSYITI